MKCVLFKNENKKKTLTTGGFLQGIDQDNTILSIFSCIRQSDSLLHVPMFIEDSLVQNLLVCPLDFHNNTPFKRP